MNAEKGAVEATAETGAAGNMVVETTADGETTTVDSETTGAEETTGEETDNNAGPSTITIGLAPNAKTPTSPSGMSAIVAKHHDQAVGAVNEENATTVVEETIVDDGTITVDSETTGAEETTEDDGTITVDSETTGVEETTETVVVNNVEHSTTTIGHARNVKTQISPLETSATVVKSHALAVAVEADDGATTGDDGTITVDSETTEDDGTITVDSETTEDDETITVDSETTGGPVATMASKGTTTEVEIAMVANSEDDLRTDEAVHDLSIVAHLMFNPGEPKESDRVMHTINPREISEMLHGSLSAEMTEWM